jgi:hypothetical protein
LTFTAVGSALNPTVSTKTFTLVPHATGDFILVGVIATATTADWATAMASSNVTWSALGTHFVSTAGANTVTVALFIGQVTSASSATVTITTNLGSPVLRVAGQEFSNTGGFAAVTLDVSGTNDTASGGSFPSITPAHGAGELFWGYLYDDGTGTAGSTSGYTYFIDSNGNPMAYNASCANAVQHPNIGDTNGTTGIAVLLYEAVTAVSGAAALSGSGSITAGAQVTQPAAAALSGSGSLAAAPSVSILPSAALIGLGVVTAGATVTVPGQGSANLSGEGGLGVSRAVTYQAAVPLSGSGSLAAQETGILQQAAALSGSGTLSVAAAAGLKFTAGLFGGGFLSIPQVAGGLVNGVGGAGTPQALPGSSQVAVAPPGSANWQWLGTLGQVTALTYSYVCPGGADQMTMTIMAPAAFRTQLFDPGQRVKITRGGMDIWHGKLDEPQYVPGQGWNLTAVGAGNRGTDFVAYYAVGWPGSEPDEIINRAIIRGLPWVNPGLNSSPYASQFWFGQEVDPGAQTVTDFLNLITSRGALTWYVNSQPGGLYGGDDLSVFPLPTVPTRLLVCTTPVARTLGGDINTIFIRFTATSDNAAAGAAATYSTVTAVNAQSVAAHGTLETYIDLSDVGQMSSAAAQAVGNAALQLYQRASFAGPFTVSYGQLLNAGGAPVDIGADQASSVCRLVLSDFAYGGEVAPSAQPITFCVGAYSYDDIAQVATVTPMQVLDQSLTGMLAAWNTANTPVTVAG